MLVELGLDVQFQFVTSHCMCIEICFLFDSVSCNLAKLTDSNTTLKMLDVIT